MISKRLGNSARSPQNQLMVKSKTPASLRNSLPVTFTLFALLCGATVQAQTAPNPAGTKATGTRPTKTTAALSLLQFRGTPSVYVQLPDEANGITGGASFSGTVAWAPSYRITPRFYLRAQADITPLNTTEGIAITPGASLGVLYRFSQSWAAELDGGAQFWSVGMWPLARALVVFSPAKFGLSPTVPIRFHLGYQPLLGAVTTHGALLGLEIAFL
jgi:hypothetical protein